MRASGYAVGQLFEPRSIAGQECCHITGLGGPGRVIAERYGAAVAL